MSYRIPATRVAPALIIYLLNVGESMQGEMDGVPKIEYLNRAISSILRRMVQRSTTGATIHPRYRLAMLAYDERPIDILGGIQDIHWVVKKGVPRMQTAHTTADAAEAFLFARDLLRQELPHLQGHPAPLVCHITDGLFSGRDPEPVAQEIMQMSNDDGNVLIENVCVAPDLTTEPILDLEAWPGVFDVSEIKSSYAQKLFNMSSPLPSSYAEVIQDEGYALKPGSSMLIPVDSSDLVELAFTMSGATPTA